MLILNRDMHPCAGLCVFVCMHAGLSGIVQSRAIRGDTGGGSSSEQMTAASQAGLVLGSALNGITTVQAFNMQVADQSDHDRTLSVTLT